MTALPTAFERRFMSFAFLQNRVTLVFEAIGGDKVRRVSSRDAEVALQIALGKMLYVTRSGRPAE